MVIGLPSGWLSGTRQLGYSLVVPGWFCVRRSPTASVSATSAGGSRGTRSRTWARASSGPITARSPAFALGQVPHELPERRAQVLALQGQLDRRPEVVDLHADVVAALVEGVAVDALGLGQDGEGVGQLDLAAGARLDPGQVLEDQRRQDVAADDAG